MTVRSLWGEIAAVQNVRTPKAILSEQAQALSDATKHVLVGRIATETVSNTVMHYLLVEAPFLNRYKIQILRFEHNIFRIYPVKLVDLINKDGVDPPRLLVRECIDENELEKALQETLQSPKVHQVISSLLIQSNDYGKFDTNLHDATDDKFYDRSQDPA